LTVFSVLAVAGHVGELEIGDLGAAGGDGDLGLLLVQAGEEYAQPDLAGRHAGQLVVAGVVGEGDEVGALHGDAGIGQIVAGDGVLNAALDHAGSGRLRGQGGRQQQGGDEGEQEAGAKRTRKGAEQLLA